MSCSDIGFGNNAFSDAPEQEGATIDSMFNSMYNADRVLAAAYSYLPYGIPVSGYSKLGSNVLESLTDLQHSWKSGMTDGPRNLYYNGALSNSLSSTLSGSEAYRFGSKTEYHAIRYAWIYIENAHLIPNITDYNRKLRIAEAKIIIALSYAEMLRYVGGVPLLKSSVDVSDDMYFPRNTFAETVDYILELIEEAKDDLPWSVADISVDAGRMTRAAALGLKLRLLCFVASPTFNSDEPWHSQADAYTRFTDGYKASRWEDAYNAGVEFFQEQSYGGFYALVQPSSDSHRDRRLAFRSGYVETCTTESIISIRKGNSTTLHSLLFPNNIFSGPTLNYADMFDWDGGETFDAEGFDWSNPSRDPFFVPVENQTPGDATRDPRLYETIAVPGDLNMYGAVAPVHKNSTSYLANPEHTGFYIMKFNMQQTSDRNIAPHWPYMRYAEVLLNYAEAINEHLGAPNSTAYDLVDQVRNRVGMGLAKRGQSKTEFRAYLLKERAMEFGLEEVRWFDLVRWNMQDEFKKQLYALESYGVDDIAAPTVFTFNKVELATYRYWADNFDTKWYLSPIPNTELNKGYGMTQNPGW